MGRTVAAIPVEAPSRKASRAHRRQQLIDATIETIGSPAFVPDTLLLALAREIQSRTEECGGEIAHLKMTLDGGDISGRLSAVSIVRGDGAAELRDSVPDAISSGTLVLNLRAEASPEVLRVLVQEAIAAVGERQRAALTIGHLESFRPDKPEPVHRDLAGSATGAESMP